MLVHDVSRWGRFQDTDAAAYYEYHCRLHGTSVIYVAEVFGAEVNPITAMLKSMKRAMAAEYSRDLATKTRAGQHQVISRGYQIGPLRPWATAGDRCLRMGFDAWYWTMGSASSRRQIASNGC